MTAMQFRNYWHTHFDECAPINYLLKTTYTNKWLRIHSLPDSKRYAENDADWKILLDRQNTILQDVFTVGDEIILIANSYQNNFVEIDKNGFESDVKIEKYNFVKLPPVDIYARTEKFIDKDVIIIPHFDSDFFERNTLDGILKAIAKDELRLFFINPKTHTIVAPYDGGVDIVYADTATRNIYKKKYGNWEQQDII